tara:strand:+ start:397 stop:552 length:156 start_codon:yes stop_codon:yes gene_type:complete
MTKEDKIKQFCLIQLQILSDKENKIRKELLDCKIQREFIESLLNDLDDGDD